MLKVVGASWMQIRMSTWIIGVVLVLGIIVVILGQMGQIEEDGNYSATAYWNKETGFEIKFWGQGMVKEKIPKGAARVYFQPHTDKTGWAIIDILTQSNYPDWVQAYAAGMLEGSLSWQLIYWHWKNTIQSICEKREAFCSYIRKYLEENLKSIKKYYHNTEDPYWYQLYLFYVQIEGIQQGFEHGVKRSRQTIEELRFVDFLWMNAFSDVVDLEYKFFDTKPFASKLLEKMRSFRSVDGFSIDNHPMEKQEARPFLGCGVSLGSTFVKLVPEEARLFVAHNSAGPYTSMLKMIKNYHFKYHWSATNFWTVENKLSFSASPGAIHSMDDFYIISVDSKYIDLIVAGTPITVFSKNLWHHVSPWRQVLSGPRAVVASRLSKNASTWAEIVSRHSSGTGNKEWVIIDAENFYNISKMKEEDEEKYQKELMNAKDILWVAEQIPGHFVVEDQTSTLISEKYWATYGLPFYKNISEFSDADKVREKYGDTFSHKDSPLARIYRRDQENATTLESVMSLMRSNSYLKDPLSLGNPKCAIGARGDIPSKNSHSFPIGVTDSKVFSIGGHSGQNGTGSGPEEEEKGTGAGFEAVAGPAFSLSVAAQTDEVNSIHSDEGILEERSFKIAPFDWSKSIFSDFPHHGHPNLWNFTPINLH